MGGGIDDASTWKYCQIGIEAMTCTCVNMFILITGYFGLRIKIRTIADMILLLLSIKIPFYLAMVAHGSTFSISGFLSQFLAVSNAGYFVEDYLMLMFFSPVLNSFIERYGKKILPWVLTFVAIEFYFEEIRHDADLQINRGYSLIHFVLMYFVGRCIYLYREPLKEIASLKYVAGYLVCSLIISLWYMFLDDTAFDYSNPIVILSSACIFIPFLKHSFHNKAVNWVAKSMFCVYIFHTSYPVVELLRKFDQYSLNAFSYPTYWLTGLCALAAVFTVALLYDKLRRMVTETIVNLVTKSIKWNNL